MGLTTSAAARVLRVSTRTVLEYEKAGLLHPYRAASGWRYFSPEEVKKLADKRISKFRNRK